MATQDWWAIAKEHMNEQRAGNFTLLMRSMEPFIREKCVECRGAYTDADFAYREYSAGTGNPVTFEQFLEVMAAKGWHFDDTGMLVDLCVSEDFLRAAELTQQQTM